MSFAYPIWFWAFVLFPLLLAAFFQNEGRRRSLLRQLVAARLLDRLAGSVSVAKRRWRFVLVLGGLAALIVALTQPRYGFTWQESKRRGHDVLIAIDTSKSMLATDLAPNRLTRAKLAAQDLIAQLGSDRVGVIAFAGGAFLQAPLTADVGAVRDSIQELDTEIIPRGGTDIAAAIRQAMDAFGKGESDSRALVIFTDGEELDADGVREAEKNKDTVRIFTVGLGSADGSLIPMPGSGSEFVKDDDGQIVKSRLDEDRLRKIAEAGGGFYLHLQNSREQMGQLVRDGLGQMNENDIDAKLSRQPIERYQWPLSAALVLFATSLLMGERKRGSSVRRGVPALAKAALLLALAWPWAPARASNRAVEAYDREEYQSALEAFTQEAKKEPNSLPLQFNLGRAAYQLGEYDKALDAFSKSVTSSDPDLRARSEFNLGNTLFRRGAGLKDKEPKIQELKNALQHYDQALNVAPKNPEAKFNRDLVSKVIEELQKPPPEDQQQKQNKQDQKKDKKDDKNQKQDKSDSQSGKGQDKDQQKQDSKDQEGQDGQKQDPKDQKGDPKDQKQDGQQGKDPKDQQDQKGEKGDKDKNQGDEGKDEQSAQPDKKKEGDVKGAPQFDKEGQEEKDAKEEAAEAVAAAEGRMTEQQAKSLLESLKSEDAKVQLLDPRERKGRGRVLRDW